MFDTMTLTKSVGALCGALLVFLLIGWAGDSLYGHGHGGHGAEQAFSIDTGAEEAAPVEEVAEAPFEELFAAADAGAGEGLFRQCAACHKLDGTDGTGPHLNGVVGRDKASVAGFGYSDAAVSQQGQQWTPENLNAFLTSPRDYMPGTKMTYNGMRDAEDRANLIAYLATTGG